MQVQKYRVHTSLQYNISRGINKLEIKINEKIGNDIVIGLDSTGIKVANRGEWMRHNWHVRKGYLKMHM